MSGELIVRPFDVTVVGYGSYVYYCTSRGKALSAAWRDFAGLVSDDEFSFKSFLGVARARKTSSTERFGQEITVGGLPAFFIDCNQQYIRFVRPDSDVVLSSHPYDVEPPEARRGTPYYEERPTP